MQKETEKEREDVFQLQINSPNSFHVQYISYVTDFELMDERARD